MVPPAKDKGSSDMLLATLKNALAALTGFPPAFVTTAAAFAAAPPVPEVMSLAAFRAAFPEDAPAANRREAEAGARADFKAVRGRLIEVDEICAMVDYNTEYFHAEPGQPFVVRVLDDPNAHDLTCWTDDRHLDSYWDVDVVDGRGVVPRKVIEECWPYIDGRTHQLVRADDQAEGA